MVDLSYKTIKEVKDAIFTDLGEVLDNKTGVKLSSEEKFLTLEVNGVRKKLLLATWLVIAFNRPDIPVSCWDKIIPMFKDDDHSNIFPCNLFYRFSEPLRASIEGEYYFVPFFTRYAISRCGKMKRIKNGTLKKWHISKPVKEKNIKGGYFRTRVVSDTGWKTIYGRHRLMALTFRNYKTFPLDLHVNHEDGVPGNDDPSNLSWCTAAENNQHAYDTGLRPNGTVGICYRNFLTDENTTYSSIAMCARAIGKSHSFITSRLIRDAGKRFTDGHLFKLDNGSPWAKLTDKVFATSATKEIECRNVFTGEVFAFCSSLAASAELDIDAATIRFCLSRKSSTPVYGYNFRLKGSGHGWPNHPTRSLLLFEKYPTRIPSGYVVSKVDENHFFTERNEVKSFLNIKDHKLTDCLLSGTPVNGYRIERYLPESNLGPPIA